MENVKKELPPDRTQRWRKLERILDELDHNSLRYLPPEYLVELGKLYNETLSDLGEVQAFGDQPELRLYLNNLLGRAYGHIYQKKRIRFREIIDFFIWGFPELVRQRIHFIAGAAVIFLFASLIGFLCITNDSKLISLVVSDSWRAGIENDIKQGKIGAHFPNEYKATISSKIMFNNIKVSFLAFAWGALLGAGTIHVLIINGLLLGGLASIYHAGSLHIEFWSLILPHGVIELISIFICAGAGLMLGYAIINPGPYRRRDWFRHEGLEAVKLVIGCIPLFIIAAIVETYITPAPLGLMIKYVISAVLLAVTVLYLALSGNDGLDFSRVWDDLRLLKKQYT